MQDANKFNEELIKGLVLEFHKGMGFLSSDFDKKLNILRTDVNKQLDSLRTDLSEQMADLKLELKFDMNQLESRLNHRIDGVSTKVERVEKELSTFRKDTGGQLHDIRSSLVRIDEKLWDHEERILKLEHN